MADNAFVKILTALLKHQVKKVVGDETLGVIGQEIAALGGDKVDDQIKSWLGEKTNAEQLEKAAQTAQACFREKVTDNEIQQWMVSLPLGNLPEVVEAIDELPSSPDESKLENALRESVALNWKKLSSKQVNHAVGSFLSCLRSALLPIEKQTLMIIGRSVLRTEDKVDLLVRWFEQYIITGKPVEIKQLNPELNEGWNLAHPYPMPPNFTGRVEERKMLTDWMNKDNENRLFILRALGGFGKSALTWHWLTHDIDATEWKKVVFWSFYEGDASFEHFIEETLKYLNLEAPQSKSEQVKTLLKAMGSQKILLIMDGFERVLRAYSSMNAAYQGDEAESSSHAGRGARGEGLDCVDINAEAFLKSVCSLPKMQGKVLMTTRLTPRAVYVGASHDSPLQGFRETELTSMQPADAVEFFHKQKIKGTHTEIEAACAPYGYHPLSLRLLAGRILKDFENPADIVVAQKLKIDGDIIQQKHHVLEVSFNSLPQHEKELLGITSCFRSPVEYKTLQSVAKSKDTLDADLNDLIERGLLQRTTRPVSNHLVSTFDLHPIVRRYAYERLTAPDRAAAHERLVDYFEAVPKLEKVETLEDLAPVIELYHHMVRAGNLDEALNLFYDRINQATYYQFGAYQLQIELLRSLFLDGEDQPPRLKNESDQAWALNELANSYSLSGQPRRAVQAFELIIAIDEKNNDKSANTAITLENVASMAQIHIGALSDAERNLRRSIDLCREIEDEFWEAVGHRELGGVLSYRGAWEEAEQELDIGLKLFEKQNTIQSQGVVWSYRALRFLLLGRQKVDDRSSSIAHYQSAIQSAQRALELAEGGDPNIGGAVLPRDLVRAHWLLGAAYCASVVSIRRWSSSPEDVSRPATELKSLTLAEENLSKALNLCRQINNVEHEADILLDIARLRYAQKNYEEAKSLADEALLITERCGYVLQGADVNLFLASLALEGHTLERFRFEGDRKLSDKEIATLHAKEALKLATCDGPPYYYKVAYEEAERLLERLG
ncbi:MAG: hypothetical protein QY306_16005 [Anaerolineales bacterium]|nr:MAG: hypothetical protein QY306_16005 [Anaerolineales bacterium]